MTTETFNDNVEILGSRPEVTQLTVQGAEEQTAPLQVWENGDGQPVAEISADGQLTVQDQNGESGALQEWQTSAGDPLARVTRDGRLQIGDDLGLATADALLEAHRDAASTAKPLRGVNTMGRITTALSDLIAWVVSEVELLGTSGMSGVQTALRARLTHDNTGDSTNAELRAADFEAINQTGTSGARVGQVTGVRGAVTNTPSATNAYVTKAVGVEGAIANNIGGNISEASAFEVAPPINAGTLATLFGLRVPALNLPGVTNYAIHTDDGTVHLGDFIEMALLATAPAAAAGVTRIYTKSDGKLYIKTPANQEFDLSSGVDTEAVQDIVAALLQAGTGVAVSYNDTLGTLTVAVDNTVVQVDATQTLTNKTLTAPTITGGLIDGAAIGTGTPVAGTFDALTARGDVTISPASNRPALFLDTNNVSVNGGRVVFATAGVAQMEIYHVDNTDPNNYIVFYDNVNAAPRHKFYQDGRTQLQGGVVIGDSTNEGTLDILGASSGVEGANIILRGAATYQTVTLDRSGNDIRMYRSDAAAGESIFRLLQGSSGGDINFAIEGNNPYMLLDHTGVGTSGGEIHYADSGVVAMKLFYEHSGDYLGFWDAPTSVIRHRFDRDGDSHHYGAGQVLSQYSYGASAAGYFARRSMGTQLLPTAIDTERMLAQFVGEGWNGSAFVGGAAIQINSSQAYNGTDGGGKIYFNVAANGSLTRVEAARIDPNKQFNFFGNLVVATTAASPRVQLDSNAGFDRNVRFATSGVSRWDILANSTAEGGGGTGSHLTIKRYDDAGVLIDQPFIINRTTGKVSLSSTLNLAAATTAIPSINVPVGVAPTSPASGDMWHDSTQKALQAFLSNVKQTIPGVLFTQTGTVSVTNTTTETEIQSTGLGTLTLPAGLLTVGKTLRITISGRVIQSGSPSLTFRVKLGGTTIANTNGGTLGSAGGTHGWMLTLLVTCLTSGAAGTVDASGQVVLIRQAHGVSAAIATINTTIAQAITVTAEWGSASSGSSLSSRAMVVEVLN